jgi:transposase
MNTEMLPGWVIQDLLPKLPHRNGIIMEHGTFHQGTAIKKAVEEAGHHILYLPS